MGVLPNCKLKDSASVQIAVDDFVGGRLMRVRRIAVLCAALAGCTGADSRAHVPAFMRAEQPEARHLRSRPWSLTLFAR